MISKIYSLKKPSYRTGLPIPTAYDTLAIHDGQTQMI